MSCSKYSSARATFKIVQFCLFISILIVSIFFYDTSITEWIITGYLIIISILIFVTLFVEKIYKVFPYLQRGYKLAITVFIMGGFAFGSDIANIRSILSMVVLFISLIFLFISIFFSDEETINDIIMNDKKENDSFVQENNKEKAEKRNYEKDLENHNNTVGNEIPPKIKKGPLF